MTDPDAVTPASTSPVPEPEPDEALPQEVYDGSLSTPRIRHTAHTDEGGRGLQLVAALSKRWGARYLRDGKCIWTEQDIPQRAA